MGESFPPPEPQKETVSSYYTYYMPKGIVVTQEDMKLKALNEEIRKKVLAATGALGPANQSSSALKSTAHMISSGAHRA